MKKALILLFSSAIITFFNIGCSENKSNPVDNSTKINFTFTGFIVSPGSNLFEPVNKDSLTIGKTYRITALTDSSGLTYEWTASQGTILGEGKEIKFSLCHAAKIKLICTASNATGSITKETTLATVTK